jgi:uncharacterized protein YkwD
MAAERPHRSPLQVEQLEDRQLLAAAPVHPWASGSLTNPGLPGWAHASLKSQQVIPHSHPAHARGKPARPHARRVSPSSLLVHLTPGQEVLYQQLNLHRQQLGLPPLTLNPLLMEAAQAHADNMARQDKYGDTNTDGHILDGHDVVYRVGQVGYRFSWLGENVAYNQYYPNPPQTLADQWWNSPPHRANMLDSHFTEVGIGIATSASGRTYGVEDFGRPW